MKRFKFTLEAVQTVRERAAREALENYARALRVKTSAEAALADAEHAQESQLVAWRRMMRQNGFSPSEMLQNEHARAMLEARRNERVEEVRKASEAAAKAQATFQLAQQKSDVVERFHTRQRNEFNLNALKEEQHFLDELAGNRRESGLFEKGPTHA